MKENYKIHNELIQLLPYLEKLIDQSRDVFWIKSSDYSDQLYISPAYEKIWGRSCESLYRHPEKWIDSLLLEDQERIRKDMEQRNQDAVPGKKFFQWYRIVRPDGKIRWIEDESFAIFSKNGNHIGFAGIAQDITEKKENELYLQESKDRAEAASKAKSEFIANMSHDIKTPLAGIIGIAELLTFEPQKCQEHDFANNILIAGRELMQFVENCIDMAKSENSELIFTKEYFSLRSLLSELSDLFKPAILKKNLSFSVHYPEDIAEFFIGSRAGIYRVLLNLIGNAVKFTAKGSVRIEVEYSEKPPSSKQVVLKLAVIDTGTGIPENKQQMIFERYTRLSPSYKGIYQGIGIGLYIVSQFVKAMQGEIYLSSEEKKGSCFLVILPLEIPLLQPEEYEKINHCKGVFHRQPNATPVDPPAAIRGLKNISILLVEDNELSEKIAKSMLTDLGCQVDVANCGNQAFELFVKKKYDLVFMDVGLPDISGYTVTEKIRKTEQESTYHTPIIILTAHATKSMEENDLSPGVEAVLSKPLSKEQASQVINYYVLGKQKENAIKKTPCPDPSPTKVIQNYSLQVISEEADKELLGLLIASLPGFQSEIDKAYHIGDFDTLAKSIHKMHGGLCYTNTPQLRQMVKTLEDTLRTRETARINKCYEDTVLAIRVLQETYPLFLSASQQ